MVKETKKVNTVLIFGAGASYDMIDGVGGMPMSADLFNPLRKGLALETQDAIIESANGWPAIARSRDSISKTIKDDHSGNVEEYLWELTKKAKLSSQAGEKAQLLLVHILYYILELTTHFDAAAEAPNNYSKLLDAMAQLEPDVAISDLVSFNYDIVLDRVYQDSFGAQNLLTQYLEERHNRPRLIKPHGSASWYVMVPMDFHKIRISNMGDRAEKVRAMAEELLNFNWDINDVSVMSRATEVNNKLGHTSAENARAIQRPALIIPVMTKTLSFKKGFQPIRRALESALDKADQIILIGYKAMDDDFIDVLKHRTHGKDLRISVVSGQNGSALEIRERLIRINPKRFMPGFYFGGGFSEFVKSIEAKQVRIVDGYIKDVKNTSSHKTIVLS